MKKVLCFLLSICILSFTINIAWAVGDGNIDGGGGNLNPAVEGYYWTGYDGVRVTVVRDSDNATVTEPIDLTNTVVNNIQIHFIKKSRV